MGVSQGSAYAVASGPHCYEQWGNVEGFEDEQGHGQYWNYVYCNDT